MGPGKRGIPPHLSLSEPLKPSHLLHTLALGNILVSHTNPGVQKTFEEVSTADPHQVGSLVGTWQGTWFG